MKEILSENPGTCFFHCFFFLSQLSVFPLIVRRMRVSLAPNEIHSAFVTHTRITHFAPSKLGDQTNFGLYNQFDGRTKYTHRSMSWAPVIWAWELVTNLPLNVRRRFFFCSSIKMAKCGADNMREYMVNSHQYPRQLLFMDLYLFYYSMKYLLLHMICLYKFPNAFSMCRRDQ